MGAVFKYLRYVAVKDNVEQVYESSS